MLVRSVLWPSIQIDFQGPLVVKIIVADGNKERQSLVGF